MDDDELLRQMPEVVRPAVAAMLGLREQLAGIECTASDESGLVTAVTDVFGNLRAVRLHPTARRQLDNLSLGDAVRDAVNAATRQARGEHRRVLDGVEVFGVPLGEARADPRAVARRFIERSGLGRYGGPDPNLNGGPR